MVDERILVSSTHKLGNSEQFDVRVAAAFAWVAAQWNSLRSVHAPSSAQMPSTPSRPSLCPPRSLIYTSPRMLSTGSASSASPSLLHMSAHKHPRQDQCSESDRCTARLSLTQMHPLHIYRKNVGTR